MFSDEKTDQCGLKRELGLLEVFCIASGAMISSGLFVLPGVAYAKTGSSVILSYLIASLLMIPALLSISELTTAMPKCGGDYFFIDRSMGPAVGTIGGLSSWFALTAKTAFALIGIGAFVQLFNPGLSDISLKLIAVLFCVVFTIINLFGVKHAGRTQVYLVFGLILILAVYVSVGFFYVQPKLFSPFMTNGLSGVFATAGFIFVSFMGLTKVCSVAEEIKKPKRNIPLGMFLAWLIISMLYILVVFVTVGILDHGTLTGSLMPVSLGADVFLGQIGLVLLGVAAVLAFITTANAGLLSSSRYPLAMSKDKLLPEFFSRISKNGIPIIALFFTSGFMICIILFLDLEGLVKMASTLVLLLFIFVNFSLIVMRTSNIRHYRPSFRAPLFPWIQIAGIIGYVLLIIEMGVVFLALVGCFIGGGIIWYWFFAREKIKREYTLLHIIERITGMKKTGYLVDKELQEILIERDNVEEDRFEQLIKNCKIFDLEKLLDPDSFARLISHQVAEDLSCNEQKLYELLKKKKSDTNVMLHPGIAIFSHLIKGRDMFELVMVRLKKGLIVSDEIDPFNSCFVVIASPDQQSFYVHSLMWIVQIADNCDFTTEWVNAKDENDLRSLVLEAWKKRKKF